MSHQIELFDKETETKFERYHFLNPHIYNKFEELTFKSIAKGFKNYGAQSILELLRWHTGVSSNGDVFKINNNYAPYYSRLFEKYNPKHKGFFRKRIAAASDEKLINNI